MNNGLENLYFNENWNGGKCNNKFFTTLRLWTGKYYIGKRFNLFLKGKYKGIVEVVGLKKTYLHKLNDWIAWLDTGYSAETTKNIIIKMYINNPTINWNTQPIAYVMLKKIEIENPQIIFET